MKYLLFYYYFVVFCFNTYSITVDAFTSTSSTRSFLFTIKKNLSKVLNSQIDSKRFNYDTSRESFKSDDFPVSQHGRLCGFILDCIPKLAHDHSKTLSIENNTPNKYLSDISSERLIKFPPIFIKEKRLMYYKHGNSWMANQSIIDSVAGSYLPEIGGEQFKILFDDDDEKIYVSYPDILNELMGSCECRPMQEVALSSVYTDEIENINFDGIFPKPEVGFVDFNFKSDLIEKVPENYTASSIISGVESFISEALVQAFSPLNDNKSTSSSPNIKFTNEHPYRWKKAVNLSKLKKILRRDPDYFKQ